jgi:hypothetical protein
MSREDGIRQKVEGPEHLHLHGHRAGAWLEQLKVLLDEEIQKEVRSDGSTALVPVEMRLCRRPFPKTP